MDLDALAAARQAEWDRLDRLGRGGIRTGAEADELITRYQAASSDLATIRSTAGSTALGDRLTVLVARARLRFAGTPLNPLERIPEFFVLHLPAALYRLRWLTIAVAGAFLLVAVAYGVWAASSPQLIAALGSQADIDQYVEEDFVGYYSEHGEGPFAALVWTNNAWIAAQSVAFGISGLFVPWALLQNAQGIGLSGAMMGTHGHLDTFLLYLAPHGQLELYSLFVAMAGGLAIFWSWIAPGPRTRGASLAAAGRSLFTVTIGLAISLLVSGLIEGIVTRQEWPWWIKIGIGSVALLGFLGYQWILGRRAHLAGQTGDLDEFEAGARQLTAG
ncbi:MAG: stage II sporulation protein M [Microbacteriaceae bacterium]|nr:stage II sporulation protein M [Microbacteriaceae bacterium]